MEIIDGIRQWMVDAGLDDIKQLIGTLVVDG
jgi:hypothetical protein